MRSVTAGCAIRAMLNGLRIMTIPVLLIIDYTQYWYKVHAIEPLNYAFNSLLIELEAHPTICLMPASFKQTTQAPQLQGHAPLCLKNLFRAMPAILFQVRLINGFQNLRRNSQGHSQLAQVWKFHSPSHSYR